MDPNNFCLVPDFNISELSVDGYTNTNVINSSKKLEETRGLATDDTNKYTDSATDAKFDKILPCGVFDENNTGNVDANIYKKNRETLELECRNSTDAWVTKGTGETTDTQYYTRYKIDLPTSNGSFASATTQNYLNVRGCAMCEPASSHCLQIIKGIIESNEVNGCSCIDLDNGDGNGSCIYDKVVSYDDDGVQKTRTEHVIATNRYYDCTEAGLTNLISRLTTDGQFKLSGESGVYNNTLSCDVCLNKLEQNLRTILIEHK